MGIEGNIYLTAQSEILLRVVLVHAADGSSAAKGVTRIKRGPKAVGEGEANVSFESA